MLMMDVTRTTMLLMGPLTAVLLMTIKTRHVCVYVPPSTYTVLLMYSFTSLCSSSLSLHLHTDEKPRHMPLSSLSSVISMPGVTALPRELLSS
ncbi:hypothetical protein SRHO_G00050780 [Serrasalmus rhombeus]